jgi:hypothetical protein
MLIFAETIAARFTPTGASLSWRDWLTIPEE